MTSIKTMTDILLEHNAALTAQIDKLTEQNNDLKELLTAVTEDLEEDIRVNTEALTMITKVLHYFKSDLSQ